MQESDTEPGIYTTEIDGQYLIPGMAFKLDIITPDGTRIKSDFDRMPQCPDVDDVYYEIANLLEKSTERLQKEYSFMLT